MVPRAASTRTPGGHGVRDRCAEPNRSGAGNPVHRHRRPIGVVLRLQPVALTTDQAPERSLRHDIRHQHDGRRNSGQTRSPGDATTGFAASAINGPSCRTHPNTAPRIGAGTGPGNARPDRARRRDRATGRGSDRGLPDYTLGTTCGPRRAWRRSSDSQASAANARSRTPAGSRTFHTKGPHEPAAEPIPRQFVGKPRDGRHPNGVGGKTSVAKTVTGLVAAALGATTRVGLVAPTGLLLRHRQLHRGDDCRHRGRSAGEPGHRRNRDGSCRPDRRRFPAAPTPAHPERLSTSHIQQRSNREQLDGTAPRRRDRPRNDSGRTPHGPRPPPPLRSSTSPVSWSSTAAPNRGRRAGPARWQPRPTAGTTTRPRSWSTRPVRRSARSTAAHGCSLAAAHRRR